ncbi:TonB-dependent receptor [Chitinophaga arvensicola]|uniref:Carboxypeptidase regulatory-like domain-containing protein n=1 Tax=Chitinophaga arvensicola TaxID=29529 RepID=A0A1I0S992_9BACT|nr:TonB-dependent receptor [Chitinophaga arvensicola]SEW51602.1 Carboxypeptidase regulatory-like domain-containing protein [Chitinophaga arvensicola]
MKPLLTLILLVLSTVCAKSQNEQKVLLTGRILEAGSKMPMFGAAVSILNADSSNTPYQAISDVAGRFSIPAIRPGSYQVYIRYLGYQPVMKRISLSKDSLRTALGDLYMVKNGVTLDEVKIIQTPPPVKVKKDTLDYSAAAFKTNSQDNLAQLMRKVPGVEVMPDGALKVNGVLVKTVLIDGKGYFGNDTRMASKYLLSGLVERIQIIDRVPEETDARSSRVDKFEKVINLVIKRSSYNAWNGSASAGIGTEGHYNGGLSLNRLNADQQISIIGGANDVNGFDRNLDPMGNNGRSKIWNAGVNYNQVISPKLSVETSFSVSDNTTNIQSESTRRNTLPDSSFTTQQDQVSHLHAQSQFLTLNLTYQLDSLSTLILRNQLGFGRNDNEQQSNYESRSDRGYLMNSGSSGANEHSNNFQYNSQLIYTRKFKRQGQTLNLQLEYGMGRLSGAPYNHSQTLYTGGDGQARTDSFNLYNKQLNKTNDVQFIATYAHPLAKGQYLDFSYLFSSHLDRNKKDVFDFDPLKQHFDIQNDSLSADQRAGSYIQNMGLGYRKEGKRLDYSLGLNLFLNAQDSRLLNFNQSATQRLTSLLPFLVIKYNIDPTHRLRLDYSSTVLPPSSSQLLPVPDYSNPLLISKGNMDLRASRTDQLSVAYRFINPVSSRSFLVKLSAEFQRDKITENTTLDTLGRQFITPVNINGPISGTIVISNTFPITRLHAFLNANTLFKMSNEVSMNNGMLLNSQRLMGLQSVSFNYSHKQAWDVMAMTNLVYNGNRYGRFYQPDINTLDLYFTLKGNINLPSGFQLGTKINYFQATGREPGYNTDQLIFNFMIGKQLFKKNAALQLLVYDLFDQTNAQSRNVGESYIEDIRTNPLTRFGMLSFTWFFGQKDAR